MNRRSMLIPLAALAAVVAASPASADGNGWSCISPFAGYTNMTYPDDPPAPSDIVDSLAISVARTDASPLTAVPGQPLALRDLQLSLVFTDTRVAAQMYKRTGGATASYSGIPRGQEEDTVRSFSQRANPGDNNVLYWSYNSAAQGAARGLRLHEPGVGRTAADAARRSAQGHAGLLHGQPVPEPLTPLPVARRQQPVPARRVGDDRGRQHGRGRADRARQGLLADQHQGLDARAPRPTPRSTPTTT